ncbi:MAG: metallophosphoesterase [Propylenella sp.]
MLTRRQFMTGLCGGATFSGGLGGYAFAVEPRFRLVVTKYDLPTARWRNPTPLKIVALADIHACEPWMPADRVRAIVDEANAQEGDIIVLLGDFTAGLGALKTGPVPAREWGRALSGLSAPLGVHAIPGNHDWWTNIAEVTDALAAAGASIYQNRAQKFSGPSPFWLAGTDSMVAHRLPGHGNFRGEDNLPDTLLQIADDAPAILMAHEPDLFVKVPDRFAVTLSGHTHGGQVRLPFLGRPIVPSGYGQRFAYGHIREEGRDMIVSSGLGCSVLPVRFGVPPEITVVTLKAADAPVA